MRLGLAYCYYQLEEFDLAKLGFESVLRMVGACESQNGKCIEAMIGMSIVYKKMNDNARHYSTLVEIYNLDSNHYLLNIYLCEHYFYRKDYERCRYLCETGIEQIDRFILISRHDKKQYNIRIDMCTIKSKYYYMLGFISHDTEDKLDTAHNYYKMSLDMNSENSSALYGLGQILLHEKKLEESIKMFERIVQQRNENECNDCYRIMAYIYSKIGKKSLAKKYYELSRKYFPHDIELLIEYATYMESIDVKDSLKVYEKIVELINTNHIAEIKPELFNNYAVTLIKNKRYDEALLYINKAFDIIAASPSYNNNGIIEYFLRYNRGILYEEKGMFTHAVDEYKHIINTNPLIQDPLLRLSHISYNKGLTQDAIDICDTCIQIYSHTYKNTRIDIPYCIKASYLLDDKEVEKCQDAILDLQKRYLPNVDDPYAVLLLASTHYHLSTTLRGVNVQDQSRFE